jgi:uncharacterized protein YkwD
MTRLVLLALLAPITLSTAATWADIAEAASPTATEDPRLPTLAASADAYAYYKEAITALSQGDLDGAAAAARAGLEVLPTWVELRNLLGDCLALKGQREEAAAEYRLSLHFEPVNLHAEQALIDLGYSPKLTQTEPFERRLVDLINKERVLRRGNQLVVHPVLTEIARAHSAEMRDRNYFSHDSPTPELRTTLERFLTRFRGEPSKLAENIARKQGTVWALSEENIRSTHKALMESPGHRANILDPEFTHVGVGIAIDDRGNYWVTELFMRMD